MEDAVTKGGVCRILVTLHRTHLGVTVNVKTHPDVEEFMRALGNGESNLVGAYGRYWKPLERPLYVYSMNEHLASSDLYDLNSIGLPLEMNAKINLSFLRLVGVSEGAGVSFSLRGVYSRDGLQSLLHAITTTGKQFYIDYIKPVHLTVMVSTQELAV